MNDRHQYLFGVMLEFCCKPCTFDHPLVQKMRKILFSELEGPVKDRFAQLFAMAELAELSHSDQLLSENMDELVDSFLDLTCKAVPDRKHNFYFCLAEVLTRVATTNVSHEKRFETVISRLERVFEEMSLECRSRKGTKILASRLKELKVYRDCVVQDTKTQEMCKVIAEHEAKFTLEYVRDKVRKLYEQVLESARPEFRLSGLVPKSVFVGQEPDSQLVGKLVPEIQEVVSAETNSTESDEGVVGETAVDDSVQGLLKARQTLRGKVLDPLQSIERHLNVTVASTVVSSCTVSDEEVGVVGEEIEQENRTPKAAKRSSSKAFGVFSSGGSRKKKRWTREEEDLLKKAVEEFGEGSWSRILDMTPELCHRTQMNLKDKWRNLKKYHKL